jgi:hypothetical protein
MLESIPIHQAIGYVDLPLVSNPFSSFPIKPTLCEDMFDLLLMFAYRV